MTTDTSTFEGWVILELMGHRRLAGYLREQQIGGASFLRIDVPGKDTEPVATQFYASSAVYAITPTTERMARAIADPSKASPVQEWELPSMRGRALPAPADDEIGDLDDETPRETIQRLIEEEGPDTILRGLVEQASSANGVLRIAAERLHQVDQGYTAEHDDREEADDSLVRAALWLVATTNISYVSAPSWAFDLAQKHAGDLPTLLALAGALFAAEIDRLKRNPTVVQPPAADTIEPPPAPDPQPEPVPADVGDDFTF